MGILCKLKPKPVLPFGGTFRIIDFTLSNCVHSGNSDISVLVDHQRLQLVRYLKRWHSVNIFTPEINILAPANGNYKGTANAVYQNLSYLKKTGAVNVLLLASDHIYNMNYNRMLKTHMDERADATVGVVRASPEDIERFGTISIDQRNRILDFKEKSSQSSSAIVSMGIYVFNIDFLIAHLQEDAERPDSSHDFGYSLLPDMVKRGRVFAYTFNGYWNDIGTINSYYSAHMKLLNHLPHLKQDARYTVLTAWRGLPARRISRQNIINSIISPSCEIRGKVTNSVLSPGVVVENQTEVINSVILPNSVIGYHSIVNRCILDQDVKIGKYNYIGWEDDHPKEITDITVLGQNVQTPDYVAIGSRCKVMPNTVVADFDNKFIRPGTIIAARPG